MFLVNVSHVHISPILNESQCTVCVCVYVYVTVRYSKVTMSTNVVNLTTLHAVSIELAYHISTLYVRVCVILIIGVLYCT